MLKRLLAKASPILGSRSDWLGLCLLCRQPCDDQPLLCNWCQHSLHQPCRKCRLCAAPLPEHHAGNDLLCGRCQRRPPPWERPQVIGDYQLPYSLLIPRLKYSGQILLAPLLARLLSRTSKQSVETLEADFDRMKRDGEEVAAMLERPIGAVRVNPPG